MENRIDAEKFKKKLSSKGKKITYLRQLTGCSRAEFAKKYNISDTTLRFWELDQAPISDKLMKKFLEGLIQEGIMVSRSWIEGSSSEVLTFLTSEDSKRPHDIDQLALKKEINDFLEKSDYRVVNVISDSKNAPLFKNGDIVGGEICTLTSENHIIDNYCLVQEWESDKWELYLIKKSRDGNYALLCSKTLENPVDFPVLYGVKIKQIAPVIWLRKQF